MRMSETLIHTCLVGVIVNWVKANYSATRGLCLFCDCPPVLETEKPLPIEGFFPDVYAVTTPPALTIIGEAKTTTDLESPRSYNQFLAFLRFLAARPQPIFVVATPWFAGATVRHILSLAKCEAGAKGVRMQFLSDRT